MDRVGGFWYPGCSGTCTPVTRVMEHMERGAANDWPLTICCHRTMSWVQTSSLCCLSLFLASLSCFEPDNLEGTDKNTLQRRKYIGEVYLKIRKIPSRCQNC